MSYDTSKVQENAIYPGCQLGKVRTQAKSKQLPVLSKQLLLLVGFLQVIARNRADALAFRLSPWCKMCLVPTKGVKSTTMSLLSAEGQLQYETMILEWRDHSISYYKTVAPIYHSSHRRSMVMKVSTA